MTRAAVCLDGVSWEYIEEARTPFLDWVARHGTATECLAMVPTVTNVNNTSIITSSYPEEHGITSNWYYDMSLGREVYMDSSRYLRVKTSLQVEAERGHRTLLLTVKDKLRRLLAEGVTHSYSLEQPDPMAVSALGEAPDIYNQESSRWIIEAATREAEEGGYHLIYASTTDYVPHKHPPGDQVTREYVSDIDEALERLHGATEEIVVTADHGMNAKTVNIDPVGILRDRGIEARMVASIRDEHVAHHGNMGGSAYIYTEEAEEAVEALSSVEGIEEVNTRREAAGMYRLDAERIGDLLLGDEVHTFGPNPRGHYRDVDIRSHGSLHERAVPLLSTHRCEVDGLYNKDALSLL
ncbi:MAG: alkaline phosphatase family protein [Candidatus Bathyarchaeia archaeon]